MSSNRKQDNCTLKGYDSSSPDSIMAGRTRLSTVSMFAVIALMAVLAFAYVPAEVYADPEAGGILLNTTHNGTVSGGLYVDASRQSEFAKDLTKEINISHLNITDYRNIEWAGIYVATYCGNMETNYPVHLNTSWDYTGDDAYDITWSEYLNVSNLMPMHDGPGYVIVNNYTNRVSSDYLVYYNITELINKSNLTVHVWTDPNDFDGRIKMVTFAMAYNNNSSGKTVHYWVNEGHDTATYYCMDYLGEEYIGNTTFADVPASFTSANLTLNHMSTQDGLYWLNGTQIAPTWNEFAEQIDPTNSYINESIRTGYELRYYSGYDVWNVTDLLLKGSNNTFYYSRNYTGTGYGGNAWFKLPLVFLEVTE